jgi:hypothetical protein
MSCWLMVVDAETAGYSAASSSCTLLLCMENF